jgi:PPOX class probable F420-dependent enzyme
VEAPRRRPGLKAFERVVAAQNRFFDRLRHRDAFVVRAQTSGFGHLRGHQYALLVTYKRDGTPVPTAVWFALDGDSVVLRTETASGKVKRARRDPRVLLAPCSVRARPLGPAAEGRARVLDEAEWTRAEAALDAHYGLPRRLFEAPGDRLGLELVYLQVDPA